MKPAFPSGLVVNWKSKSASCRKVGKPVNKPKVESDGTEGPVIGGLNDDDAAADRPDFSARANLKGRKNDVSKLFIYIWNKGMTIFIQTVKIETDSDSEDKVKAVKARPKPTARYKQVAAPATAPEMAMKVKKESKAVAKVEDDPPVIVTGSNCDDNLPQFARSAWASEYLPTVYEFLGSLEKPWELSDPKEVDDVKTVQMLVDIVYPLANYKVQFNDRIYLMVRELSHLLMFS